MSENKIIVESKVRELVKSVDEGTRMSEEFLDAFNAKCAQLLRDAVVRAKGNGRATLQARDL